MITALFDFLSQHPGYVGFTIGLFVGTFIGIIVASLCNTAARDNTSIAGMPPRVIKR